MFSREAAINIAVRKSGSEPGCIGPVIERFFEAVRFQANHLLKAPPIIQPFLFHDATLFYRIKMNFLRTWSEYVNDFQDSHTLYRQNAYEVSNIREIELKCVIASLEYLGGLLLQPSRLKVTSEQSSDPKYSELDFSFLCPNCREIIECVRFNHENYSFSFTFIPEYTLWIASDEK